MQLLSDIIYLNFSVVVSTPEAKPLPLTQSFITL
jgi:hypothetical protein